MSGRPKEPKYARNKNILVIGGSGSRKTRFFVKPNLMQMHSSNVVTDPKGYIGVGQLNSHFDIVNIGLHFILKNVRPYAAFCCEA